LRVLNGLLYPASMNTIVEFLEELKEVMSQMRRLFQYQWKSRIFPDSTGRSIERANPSLPHFKYIECCQGGI
jgi:hypothetical protein